MLHYTGCGLRDVWLKNGYTVKDTPYGQATAIHNREALHKTIGFHWVNNQPVLIGEVIRFLRKEMDLTQQQLGHFLGVNESTVRNWENDHQRMPTAAALVLRGLYASYIKADSDIRTIVERMAQLNRGAYWETLHLEDTETGWRTATL